jgi:hypothetical protein
MEHDLPLREAALAHGVDGDTYDSTVVPVNLTRASEPDHGD